MSDDEQFEIEEVPTSDAGTMVVFWIVVIVVLVALGSFFFMRAVDGIKAARLLTGHELTEGVIYEGSFGRRDSAHYRVSIEGESYTGMAGKQARGEPITIAYLPDDPSVNRPASGLVFDALFGCGVIIAVPIFLGYIFFAGKGPPDRGARRNKPASTEPDESN